MTQIGIARAFQSEELISGFRGQGFAKGRETWLLGHFPIQGFLRLSSGAGRMPFQARLFFLADPSPGS